MATSTKKDMNTALRGALVDEADGTVSQQITIIGTTADSGRVNSTSTKKDPNDAFRGALVDELDGTITKQIRIVQ